MKTIFRFKKLCLSLVVLNLIIGGVICFLTKKNIKVYKDIIMYISIAYICFAGFIFSLSGTSLKHVTYIELVNSSNPNYFNELKNDKCDGELGVVITAIISGLFSLFV